MEHSLYQYSSFQMPLQTPTRQPVNTPQISGGYTTDASSIHMKLPDLSGKMAGVNDTFLIDSNEAKRSRISRACQMCRTKKTKCDGKLPACTQCIISKTDCVVRQTDKKRSPRKSTKYIRSLENRIARVESLLKECVRKRLGDTNQSSRASSTAIANLTSPSQDTHVQDSARSTLQNTLASQEPQNGTDPGSNYRGPVDGGEPLASMTCSLVINDNSQAIYIGPSSAFSILSPRGMQWISEKTDDSFRREIVPLAADEWIHWKPDIFGDLFERQIFCQLPPKTECIYLVEDFFENFNCIFPIFHQRTFMLLVDRQYSRDPCQGSGWWACLNVVLAIAYRLRVARNLVPQDKDQRSWSYLKNAIGVFTELTMRNNDLQSVQALLGMALLFQGTPNPQPSFFIVAAAIRISYSIGLHKREPTSTLNSVEIEQRKRVFWIGYILEKDMCLRTGRPPAQDDDDMNMELPSADPEDNAGNLLVDGKGKINLFRLLCELAILYSQVYKQLYSAKVANRSVAEQMDTIGKLDRYLQEWKSKIPVSFRPEHGIKNLSTPLVFNIVVLHIVYYNCLASIHRVSIHGCWTSRTTDRNRKDFNVTPLGPSTASSTALCVLSARATIRLIKYIPQEGFACGWTILYFLVSALMILFYNILRNPQDPRARSDIRLMNLVISFLSTLGREEENGEAKSMHSICSVLERIAKVVLDSQEPLSLAQRKSRENSTIEVALIPISPNPSPPIPASVNTPVMAFLDGRSQQVYVENCPSRMNSSSLAKDGWLPDNGTGSTKYFSSNAAGTTPFEDMHHEHLNGHSMDSPLGMNSPQQPFFLQDMWPIPLALQCDSADTTSDSYFSFEDGTFDYLDVQNGDQER